MAWFGARWCRPVPARSHGRSFHVRHPVPKFTSSTSPAPVGASPSPSSGRRLPARSTSSCTAHLDAVRHRLRGPWRTVHDVRLPREVLTNDRFEGEDHPRPRLRDLERQAWRRTPGLPGYACVWRTVLFQAPHCCVFHEQHGPGRESSAEDATDGHRCPIFARGSGYGMRRFDERFRHRWGVPPSFMRRMRPVRSRPATQSSGPGTS